LGGCLMVESLSARIGTAFLHVRRYLASETGP
jgi:hypothetical protein